jgi:hypothetical protein
MTITNHRHILSFTKTTKAKGKKHEDDGFVASSSCLRKTRTIGGGENDNNHILLLSSVFHRSEKGHKKITQKQWLCAVIFVSEMSENKEKEAKTMMICVIVVVFYFSQE